MLRKFLMPALLAIFLLWLMFFADREKPASMQTLAMGTLVDMTVLGLGGQTNHQALQDAVLEMRKLEKRWHPDQLQADGSGLLAKLNQQLSLPDPDVGPEPLPVVQELQPGFEAAARYNRQSQGLFEPTIGALVKLWGFDSDANYPTTAPAPELIQAARSGLSFDQVYKAGLLMPKAAMRLDFGAFAKGYLLQQVADKLSQDYPQASFLLNGGGDLLAVGSRPERPWRIAVRHPRLANKFLATLDLQDNESAFTSGDYERYFDVLDATGNSRHLHHILDPRSGWPAEGTQSLTVLHADGGLADAASTALFVAGDNWPALAAAMGVDAVLRVAADGSLEWTPAMAARAELSPNADGSRPQPRLRTLP